LLERNSQNTLRLLHRHLLVKSDSKARKSPYHSSYLDNRFGKLDFIFYFPAQFHPALLLAHRVVLGARLQLLRGCGHQLIIVYYGS